MTPAGTQYDYNETIIRRHFLRRMGGAAVGVSAFGLLAACGDDATAESSAEGGDDSSALKPVSMQVSWIADAQNFGWFTAIDNGYFADEGLDMTWLSGGPDVSPEAQLLTGAADFGVTTPDATATAVAVQGAPFKIVGTVFQTNPLGVMSLVDGTPILTIEDLIGKRIAASQGAAIIITSTLQSQGFDPDDVAIVPYLFDLEILTSGEVDGTAEFCTDAPWIVEAQGFDNHCVLFADMGYRMFQNTITVTEETLADRRDDVVGFLRAGRRGWAENLADPAVYPPLFEDTWQAGTGLTAEHQTFYNTAQKPLVESPAGILSLTEESVAEVVATFNAAGIDVSSDLFDLTVQEEI